MAKKLVKNPNDFESVIVNGCLNFFKYSLIDSTIDSK